MRHHKSSRSFHIKTPLNTGTYRLQLSICALEKLTAFKFHVLYLQLHHVFLHSCSNSDVARQSESGCLTGSSGSFLGLQHFPDTLRLWVRLPDREELYLGNVPASEVPVTLLQPLALCGLCSALMLPSTFWLLIILL